MKRAIKLMEQKTFLKIVLFGSFSLRTEAALRFRYTDRETSVCISKLENLGHKIKVPITSSILTMCVHPYSSEPIQISVSVEAGDFRRSPAGIIARAEPEMER